MEPGDQRLTKEPTALERARGLSNALSEAARRARFSTRSKRYTGGGFQARRGARIMRLAIVISFYLVVAFPTLIGAVYYGLVASDQYISEARFTVSGGESPKLDTLGALTGLPAAAIIQDTQIVTNYIQSRAAVDGLEKAVSLRELYSRPSIDWWARFRGGDPVEKLVKYWQKMIDISVKMPSGIVELKVHAFAPADANRIVSAVLMLSESMINELNYRMNRDAVRSAEQQLERATTRLTHTRLALEKARDEEGLLDVNKSVEALNGLINETRGSLLQLQQEYASQRQSVQESAPQMRALKARIESTATQIAVLESKLTATKKLPNNEPTLTVMMTKFSELDLERQIAERLYAAATSSLELARLAAERKAMYINPFVTPRIPEDSQYPRPMLFTFLIFVVCLTVWSVGCGIATLVRNHMA
jgi:capsular polysaccharide transport system permease protein